MNTESDPKPVTISGGVSFLFEKAASDASEDAKTDFLDRPYQIREWVGEMEKTFRILLAKDNATDEDAAFVAIAIFNPTNTAKMRLGWIKGWWHRLFYYERYSTHRLLAPVALGLFHSWYRTSGSLEITVIANQSLGTKMVLFGSNYFSGLFIIAIVFITRAVTRWFPKFRMIGYGMALLVAAKVFIELAIEWYGSVGNWLTTAKLTWDDPSRYARQEPLSLHLLAGADYLIGYTVEAVMFFVVLALVLIEIFNLPGWRRERKMRQLLET